MKINTKHTLNEIMKGKEIGKVGVETRKSTKEKFIPLYYHEKTDQWFGFSISGLKKKGINRKSGSWRGWIEGIYTGKIPDWIKKQLDIAVRFANDPDQFPKPKDLFDFNVKY